MRRQAYREWNTFKIRMVGDKVTVWLNDVLVVDNVTMENYWNRAIPIYPTGQIELQNHSSPCGSGTSLSRNSRARVRPRNRNGLLPAVPRCCVV